MRIALCLSGQPRSFEKGFEFYRNNLLERFDVDVYLHTWYYDFFDYNKLSYLYKPKSIKIQNPLNINLDRFSRYCRYNTFSLFYGINQSFQLCQEIESIENFRYDWVVRGRFDFALNFVPEFSTLDKEEIYVPVSLRNDICNDQFAICSSENMEKYATTVNHISDIINSGCNFAGEDILSSSLKMQNVWNKVNYIDMNDPFLPDQYGCMMHSLIRDDFEFWSDK